MHAKLLSLALTLTLTACAQAAPADTSTVWVTVPCPESSGSEQQDQPSSTPAPTTTPEKNAPHVRTKWSTSYYTTFTVTAGGDQPTSTESTVPLSRDSGNNDNDNDDDDDRRTLTVTVHPTETDVLVETRTTTITTTTDNVEKRSVKKAAATPVLFYPTDLVKSKSRFPAPSIEYLKSVPEPILALVPTMVMVPDPSNTTANSTIPSTSTATTSSESGLAREISIPTGIRKQDGHYE